MGYKCSDESLVMLEANNCIFDRIRITSMSVKTIFDKFITISYHYENGQIAKMEHGIIIEETKETLSYIVNDKLETINLTNG